ncbi:MAG: hypothetical protein J2P18_11320 [Nocardia sp.]|nr:hypothetical protein [Nocardia sp.]
MLSLSDPAERENLATFLTHAIRLDQAAVIRLRRRGDRLVTAWAATGFEVLATRTVVGELTVPDITVAGDAALAGLGAPAPDGSVELGLPMDSAWRTALPPATGFVHVDDIPARSLVELAERGANLAAEHSGGHGPPAGLLEQTVLTVTGNGERVEVPMRVVFALTAMDFIAHGGGAAEARRIPPSETVRVRANPAWLRLDARYGSVARRRGAPLLAD